MHMIEENDLDVYGYITHHWNAYNDKEGVLEKIYKSYHNRRKVRDYVTACIHVNPDMNNRWGIAYKNVEELRPSTIFLIATFFKHFDQYHFPYIFYFAPEFFEDWYKVGSFSYKCTGNYDRDKRALKKILSRFIFLYNLSQR